MPFVNFLWRLTPSFILSHVYILLSEHYPRLQIYTYHSYVYINQCFCHNTSSIAFLKTEWPEKKQSESLDHKNGKRGRKQAKMIFKSTFDEKTGYYIRREG